MRPGRSSACSARSRWCDRGCGRVGPIIAIILINIVISVSIPGVSLWGHVGGLVAGTAAAAGLLFAPRQHRMAIQAGSLAGLTALLLVVIGVTAAAI